MKKILTIEGMSCEHCVARVTDAIEKVNGVKSVKIKLKNGTAKVKLDREVEDKILKEAVEDAGYEVTDIK